jgi:hypothetical protein
MSLTLHKLERPVDGEVCSLRPECRPARAPASWEVQTRGEHLLYLCDRHALGVVQQYLHGPGAKRVSLSHANEAEA